MEAEEKSKRKLSLFDDSPIITSETQKPKAQLVGEITNESERVLPSSQGSLLELDLELRLGPHPEDSSIDITWNTRSLRLSITSQKLREEMGLNVQPVCAECAQKCRLFHGKERSFLSLPTSFFKPMVDDNYLKHMYIPPKFGRTVSALNLLDKKVILKDSSGDEWNVIVSLVDNNSYAFEEGWNDFAFDHGLEIGHFLLFNYINESHLDVLIFDRSGCPKLDFSKKRNQKKRCRDTSGSSVRDGLFVRHGATASVVSMPDVPKKKSQHREVDLGGTQNIIEKFSNYDNSNGRAQSVCVEEHFEDPCYMTSRHFGDIEREEFKTSTFDVLDCEILNNCGGDGTGKITTGDSKVSLVDYGSHVYQNDAIICYKDPLFDRILGRGAPSVPSEFELSGRNNSTGQKDKSAYDKNSTLKLEENRENNSIMSNRNAQECQFAEGLESKQVVKSPKKHALHIGGFHSPKQMFNGIPNSFDAIDNGEMLKMTGKAHVDMTPRFCSFKDKLHATGQLSKGIKKELVDMSPNMYKDELLPTGEMFKRIKRELEHMTPKVYKDELAATGLSKVIKQESGQSSDTLNEDNGNHFQTASTVSCVVLTDNDSSLELPARLPFSHKGRVRMERMVVYLRDPQRRLWPVLYHERSCFKALTNGWSEYQRANNIQATDVCTFGVENESKRIIAVDVVHK